MPTALKTWARLRAPVLCITGTGSGVGIPLAKGGRIITAGVTADTYNVTYEGPVFLSEQKTMLRTDFNPSNITGTTGFPQGVRSPYFTADSPFSSSSGNFIEWNAGGPFTSTQTITEDQKEQLIGQEVTLTSSFFVMSTDAFTISGQSTSPATGYIVTIGNLTQV